MIDLRSGNKQNGIESHLGMEAFQAEAFSTVVPFIAKDGVRVTLKSNISDVRIESSTILKCANALSERFGMQVVPAQLFGHRTFEDLFGFLYQDSYRLGFESAPSTRYSTNNATTELLDPIGEPSFQQIDGFNRSEILESSRTDIPYLIFLTSGTSEGLARIKAGLLILLETETTLNILASLEYHGAKAGQGMGFRDAWIVRSLEELKSKLRSNDFNLTLSISSGTENGTFLSLFQDDKVRNFLGERFRNGDLESIAALWKKGLPVDWSAWYPDSKQLEDERVRNALLPKAGSSDAYSSSNLKLPLAGEIIHGFNDLEFLSLRFCGFLLLQADADFVKGKSIPISQIRKKLIGSIRFERFFQAVLFALESKGWIRICQNEIQALEAFPSSGLSLSDLKEECRDFGGRYPHYLPHLELLLTCAENTLDILMGRKTAVEILFPDMSMKLVASIYNGNTLSEYYNLHTSAVIRAEVEQILRKDPHRKVKILEIGAGTGGTSRYVFDALKDLGGQVAYQYTDIGASLVQYGKDTYSGQLENMEFKLLDIEKDPFEQGFKPGIADIVFSANAIHATSNIRHVLGAIRKLMTDSGTIIFNEVTSFHIYSTLTFGLLDGWWHFEDDSIRIPHSPLLAFRQWEHAFESMGFCCLKSAIFKAAVGGFDFQDVLVAKCAV